MPTDAAPITTPYLQASAILLGALGIALLFAPVEASAAFGWGATSPAAASVAAGGVLAIAILNWMGKRAVYGGIFGRPIVLANLTLSMCGGLALLKLQLTGGAPPLGWMPVLILLLNGALFARLLLGGVPGRA